MSDETDIAEEPQRMLFGIKLQPFSWGRRAALQRLLFDEMSKLELELAIVFICTKDRESIDRVRGEKEKAKFRAEMEKWADDNKITPKSRAEELLSKIAEEIWTEYIDAQFEPVTGGSGGDAGGNALG